MKHYLFPAALLFLGLPFGPARAQEYIPESFHACVRPSPPEGEGYRRHLSGEEVLYFAPLPGRFEEEGYDENLDATVFNSGNEWVELYHGSAEPAWMDRLRRKSYGMRDYFRCVVERDPAFPLEIIIYALADDRWHVVGAWDWTLDETPRRVLVRAEMASWKSVEEIVRGIWWINEPGD